LADLQILFTVVYYRLSFEFDCYSRVSFESTIGLWWLLTLTERFFYTPVLCTGLTLMDIDDDHARQKYVGIAITYPSCIVALFLGTLLVMCWCICFELDTILYVTYEGRRAEHYSNTKPIPRSSLAGPVKVSLVSYGLQPVRGSVKYVSVGVMRCLSVSGLEQESLYVCNVRCISDASC